MPILSKALKTVGATTLISSVFLYQRTKHSSFVPISPNDPIFSSAAYAQNNPHRNPATQDLCVRRVPIGKVKPGLVDALLKAQAEGEKSGVVSTKEGAVGRGEEGKGGWSLGGLFGSASVKDKVVEAVEAVKGNTVAEGPEYALVEHFCAGIWSGLGAFSIPLALFNSRIAC